MTDVPPGDNANPGPDSEPVPDASRTLTRAEQVGFYVDMWKKAVDVQQHFNDIQWRIRGLALTVATFALGAAGITAKDGTQVGPISLGAVVATVGLVLWYAFYFVDRYWYHVFLKASVTQGQAVEDLIRNALPDLPGAGFTNAISSDSHNVFPGRVARALTGKKAMASTERLSWFYAVGAFAFLSVAVALQVGAYLQPSKTDDQLPSNQPMYEEPSPAVTTTAPQPDDPPAGPSIPQSGPAGR